MGKTTHGKHDTPEYTCWDGMMQRCHNPKCWSYHLYGGRGITVCDRWRKFENFFADMGPKPEGLSIDRIDNDKGYEPSNCRWATAKQQTDNRRPYRISEAGREQRRKNMLHARKFRIY